MTNFLEKVALSFARAFGASLLVLSTGVLSAPDLSTAKSAAIAALIAAVAAGVKAVQVLVPGLTFASLLSQPWAAWLDAFARAAVGAFLVAVLGVLYAPDWATAKSLAVAAIIGAVAAGLRAVQGFVSQGETPLPDKGL